ncbi:nuclear transport factor 2 family protein [Pedobacter lithocola]|uniref:Nuclear transport factor 2 family protein n=1 Tax=Pedobacter lithocola TaxID=1908239 RepID=A0ABV8P6E8_9SPHI
MKKYKTAKELLLSYLENINDPNRAIELFSLDAIVELPYLKSEDRPWNWRGIENIYSLLRNIPNAFKNIYFENVQIHIETPDRIFAEYAMSCTIAGTGNKYSQTFVARIVAEKGEILFFRESIDMLQSPKVHQ